MKELAFSVTRKDFDFQTFRAGGKGGQKQNKTNSGVRIVHRESGAVGESRTERSQSQNRKLAFRRLTDSQKFKIWLNKKLFELSHDEKEIQRKVDLAMKEDNLKVEGKIDGKWTELKNKKSL